MAKGRAAQSVYNALSMLSASCQTLPVSGWVLSALTYSIPNSISAPTAVILFLQQLFFVQQLFYFCSSYFISASFQAGKGFGLYSEPTTSY